MNNFSDTHSLTIEPIKFLELNKSEILFILRKEMRYTEEKACIKFDFMTNIIVQLKPLRACKLQTIDYLEETIKQLSPKVKTFMVNFLLKAIDHDDTYCYAFNFLAHIANRYQLVPIALKFIDEHELLASLEQEKHPVNNSQQAKPSLQQIALKYAWEGKPITQQNKDEIAISLGFKSGNALYNHYCKFANRTDRIADPDATKKIMKNKIKLFESFIEMLPEGINTSPHNELKILKDIFEKKYS